MPDAQGLLSAVAAAAALHRGPGAAHQPPALPDKGLSGKVAQLLGGNVFDHQNFQKPPKMENVSFLGQAAAGIEHTRDASFTILAFL